jgi:hypothetical protein
MIASSYLAYLSLRLSRFKAIRIKTTRVKNHFFQVTFADTPEAICWIIVYTLNSIDTGLTVR